MKIIIEESLLKIYEIAKFRFARLQPPSANKLKWWSSQTIFVTLLCIY